MKIEFSRNIEAMTHFDILDVMQMFCNFHGTNIPFDASNGLARQADMELFRGNNFVHEFMPGKTLELKYSDGIFGISWPNFEDSGGIFADSQLEAALNSYFIRSTENTFLVDQNAVIIYGWQPYVLRDTVEDYLEMIRRGEPINPVVVQINESGGFRLAAVYLAARGLVDGGHHRAYSHGKSGKPLKCRFSCHEDLIRPIVNDRREWNPVGNTVQVTNSGAKLMESWLI